MKIVLIGILSLIVAFPCLSQKLDTLKINKEQRAKLKGESLLTNFKMNDVYQEVNELSYFAPLGELGPNYEYLFSADINPLFFLSGGVRSRWNIALGAKVKIRMFRDSSFSVRTPSYMPNIRLYHRFNNTLPKYAYGELNIFHHSNGQDAPSKINNEWNTYNGNFSTNFFKVGMNWGNYDVRNMYHWCLFVHQHWAIEGALEQDKNLKHVYGQTRLNGEWVKRIISRVSYTDPSSGTENFALFKETWRFHANSSYTVLGLKSVSIFNILRRLNLEATAYYSLKSWKKASFFASTGYYGEDPYNIYFHKHYGFFRLGIATGGMFLRIDPGNTAALQ